MSVTLENYRDFHIQLELGGAQKIHFFAFNGRPVSEAKNRINEMRSHFARLPVNHRMGIAPIFLLDDRPLGGRGGGTYPDVMRLRARNESVRERRAAAWGASFEVIEQCTREFGRIGSNRNSLHVIPLDRWNRRARATTVIHECAHGVDSSIKLHRRGSSDPLRAGRRFSASDFPASLPGQACGHGTELNRRAVNAYVSMMTGFKGVRVSLQRRIIETFRESNAFSGVNENWWATHFPGSNLSC